jgi:hypothetical protein
MKNTSKLLPLTVGMVGFLTFITDAGAATIFAPNPPTITPVGLTYRWDYQVIVSQGSEVRSGDGFTIYDFGGFGGVAGSLPGGWALNASQTNAPDYPFETRATTDNAAIIDLILTYSGATVGSTSSNTSLGTFSFISDFPLRADSFFESLDHTIFNGAVQSDNHNTQVPLGVPEPAAMCGTLGFLSVVFAARRPRK